MELFSIKIRCTFQLVSTREGMSTADNIIQHEELGLAVWSTKMNCPINIVKYNKPKMLKGLRPKGWQSVVLLNFGDTRILALPVE